VSSGVSFEPGALVPGTKYRVVRQLGEGGMGVVYQVVKPPQIPGVMKVMARQLAVHQEYRQRFVDEVRVLAQLEHPNIVRVFDYDALPDGTPFYVMELLTGRTVREALATLRHLPPRVAFEVTRQLLEALHAAHTHEVPVVHRDIKPENIFLHSPRHGDPVVKLIDFGVVAFLDRQPEGAFVGTWSYAAPEQIRGEAATPMTDIYAVGLVLYEMLAGVGPFDHLETEMLVSHAHLTVAPPKVTTFAPWVPRSIEQLIDAALSKDPSKRPRDAYAFSEQLFELEWASDGSDPGDRTREGPLSRVLTTLAGGAPSAAPAHSPLAPGVVRVPAEAQLHGPTVPGVGGPLDTTTPGEDSLLDGLDARAPGYEPVKRERESNRDVARRAAARVEGAGVNVDSSPRPPTAVTEAESRRADTDTFATQETTTTPRARAVSGTARWPMWVGLAAVLLIGGGTIAALQGRAATTSTGAAIQALPPPTDAVPAPPTATAPPTTAPAEPTAPLQPTSPTPSAVAAPPTVVARPKPTAAAPTPSPRVSAAPATAAAPVAAAPPATTTPAASSKPPPSAKPATSASGGFIRVFD
jgi:eukaryotic-like serine/threonine-protein kinase